MHHIRRAAIRATSSAPSTSFISKQRTICTTPFVIRSKIQSGIPTSAFRRFNSNEARESSVESADSSDHSSVQSAISSASETASTYASDAASSLSEGFGKAENAVADGAAAAASAVGFGRREGGFRERREPPRDVKPTNTIYVGNLLFELTSAELKAEFESFGNIGNVTIATDARGLSKGFGYVEFESVEQAAAAIQARHLSSFEGRRIVVNYMAKSTRPEGGISPPSKTLFIGNLAFEMSDADLNKLFRGIKNVIDVRVAIDRRTGQPRGFAHADFVDVDSAKLGFEELKDKEVYGRKLRVDYSAGAKDRLDRPRRPSASSNEESSF